jgi:cell wall-associated NlpC family hydrolase
VASHKAKRAVRGALSIAAVVAAVSFSSPVPAIAQPADPAPPSTASEALKQYQDLSAQASKVNEDLLAAQNDLTNRQADLNKATADLAAAQQSETTAKAQEEQFRGTVDALANASFQGARFTSLSALLTGGSQQDFLDRASALNMLASENSEALSKYSGAVNQAAKAREQATDAQNRSQEAKTKAEGLIAEINKTKTDLDARVAEAEKAYNKLSGKDKQDLVGPVDHGVYLAPAGAAQAAVQTALDQVGDRYVYGAAGPDQFDCSGLTMYAYKAVNVSLPHSSRAQYTLGKAVASGEWIAGDLLFYGGSAGSIHHVGMYIGNGKMVHASTSGVPVKVVDAPRGGGGDYLGARRILG